MEPLNVKTPGGNRASGEAAIQRELNHGQDTAHGRSNIIRFPTKKRRTESCCNCGVPLVASLAATCETCNEWLNLLARIAGRAAMPALIGRP